MRCYLAFPDSVSSALHSWSGTCPLNTRDDTAYHRGGFRDSVDLIEVPEVFRLPN